MMKHSKVMEIAERFDADPENVPGWIKNMLPYRESRNVFMLSAYDMFAKGKNVYHMAQNFRSEGFEVLPEEICVIMSIINNLDSGKDDTDISDELTFIKLFCDLDIDTDL